MSLKQRALEFATKAHQGQTRKGSGEPYINHPIMVAEILELAGFSDEVVAAGYLHDVVEDTFVDIEEIHKLFGKQVSDLVSSHSEDKSLTWEQRKAHTIKSLKTGTKDQKALIAADKYANLISLIKDYGIYGDNLWNFFNRGYEKQRWYNLNIANNLLYGLDETEVPPFFHSFINQAKIFFNH